MTWIYIKVLLLQELNRNWLKILNFNTKNNTMTNNIIHEMPTEMLLWQKKEYLQIIWKRALEIQMLDIFLVIILIKVTLKMIQEPRTLNNYLSIKPKFLLPLLDYLTLQKLLLTIMLYLIQANLTNQ